MATPASAAITLQLQQVGTAISDGINPTTGVFDVFLTSDDPTNDFTGADQILRGFQVNVATTGATSGSINAATVSLGPVGDPIGFADAFPGASVNPLPVVDGVGGVIPLGTTPYDLSTGSPIGLMSVAFTTAATETGTFDVSFVTSGATPTLLFNDVFLNPTFTGVTGTMTVTAVPEPASCLFLGSLAVAGGCSYRRRQKAKTASA